MKQIISNYLFALFLFTGGGSVSFGQSLSELIGIALANNYQIQILKNNAEIAKNNNTLGNSGQLPTVTLNGGISGSSNNTRQEFADGSLKEGTNAQSTNSNFSLLANWTAFDGFGVYAQKDKLGYLEQLGDLNTRFYIEQTVADIVTAYYQLIYENTLLKSRKLTLAISAYRLMVQEKRKLVGAGTMIDFGQALVDYNTDSITYIEQQTTIRSLEIELNRILSRDTQTPINFSDTLQSLPVLASKDSIASLAQKNNAQLQAFMLNELISEADLRMEKALRYPAINIFAGYQFTQSTAEVGFIELNRNLGPVLGLNVSFNLYNGGIQNTAVNNALLETQNTSLNTQSAQLNLQAEIDNLYNHHESLLTRISLAQINLKTMEAVYKTAADQLSKGDISGYEFRLTQLALLQTQLTLTSLQFSLKLVEVNLHRIAGTVLDAYL